MHIDTIKQQLADQYPHQLLYRQAVSELLTSLEAGETVQSFDVADWARLERLLAPERVVSFRVTWETDAGELVHNTGYRVQFNSALGPYKGGLRFDPSVTEDTLKFLGFEQIFKNALTGLPLGGGKGGSDFNPKGRSDAEIRRFSRAFMLGLQPYIGLERDVPAGDIGVGAREIGYLFGAYKDITHTNEGALTGKDELFGGACKRTEATGHGVAYFAEAMAKQHGISLEGMRAVVSGSGNVAEHAARKLRESGVQVVTLSDRHGFLYKESGFTNADLTEIARGKRAHATLSELSITGASYEAGKPWGVVAELYVPCATQNELDERDAEQLVQQAKLIVEGANMPLTEKAAALVRERKIPYAPGKAANAGGVTVSGIEMAQNAGHYAWTCETVERELKRVMQHIHDTCVRYGQDETGAIDYVDGANRGGFVRVFDAMGKLGW